MTLVIDISVKPGQPYDLEIYSKERVYDQGGGDNGPWERWSKETLYMTLEPGDSTELTMWAEKQFSMKERPRVANSDEVQLAVVAA